MKEAHDHFDTDKTERVQERRATSVVRTPRPAHLARGFVTLTHLSEPQHHDSRDLRRVVHGRVAVPLLSATPHHQVPS